jgi:hypothetical protein
MVLKERCARCTDRAQSHLKTFRGFYVAARARSRFFRAAANNRFNVSASSGPQLEGLRPDGCKPISGFGPSDARIRFLRRSAGAKAQRLGPDRGASS